MRIKVTYGFLCLALGLMLTDVWHLAWPTRGAASAESSRTAYLAKQ